MKRVFHIISLALFFVLFISCQPSPMLLLSGPHTYIFAHDGGAQNITFTCNRDWRVNTSESWILVSPSSGEASEEAITVKITCVANNTYDARTASITVIADELVETITINQETDFGLFVSPTSFNLTNTGQTIEVEVKHNVDYTIEIDEACRDWIREGQTKALSADKVTFLISANPSFENREGKISFKQTFGNHSQMVNICQHQTDTLYFEDAPFLDISGESQILELKINANCEYDIEVNAPNEDYEWIRYVETKGITSSVVVLSVDAYEDNYTGERYAYVLAKGKNNELMDVVNIYQHQKVPESAVDMGLSVFWGECNVGASTPEEFGEYYAWGEVEPKDDYTWDTYKWFCWGSNYWTGEPDWDLTKYSTWDYLSVKDDKTILDADDDVAHMTLGGKWRMPTAIEAEDLMKNCNSEFTIQNGVPGLLLTSKYNGNSIFLPAGGWINGNELIDSGKVGFYWLSSLCTASNFYADNIQFVNNPFVDHWQFRMYGQLIRPIVER